MKTSHIIIGVLLFAIATMIIYVWGLKRQVDQSKDLMNLLFSNGEQKIKNYLKKNDSISKAQARELISGLSARFPFTTAKAVVENEEEFVDKLFAYMERTGQIEDNHGRYYRVK